MESATGKLDNNAFWLFTYRDKKPPYCSYCGALGNLYGKSLQAVMLDSWEAGMQNWTDNMLTEFKKRRGYDLAPFLPCLSGHVMGNSDISDRVLWDFRRTLAAVSYTHLRAHETRHDL